MRSLAFLVLLAACHPRTSREVVLLHEDGVENAYPRLSAGGAEILYQSNRSGRWQLYILDRARGTSRLLDVGGGNNNLADWSASQLAFVSDRDGDEEIYLAERDGSNVRRLTTHGGRDIHPYFSPDGKTLLYNSERAGSLDVIARDLATGQEHAIAVTPDDETCARLSPDGSRIVVLRNSVRSDDVWVIDVASGGATNLTQTPSVRDGWPTWSPDGRWIYFASMSGGSFSIYRVHPDGTALEQRTHATQDEEDARPFVSADLLLFNRRSRGAIDIVITGT